MPNMLKRIFFCILTIFFFYKLPILILTSGASWMTLAIVAMMGQEGRAAPGSRGGDYP